MELRRSGPAVLAELISLRLISTALGSEPVVIFRREWFFSVPSERELFFR